MGNTRKIQQHIAIFGESGSGKTVLLSSFYGAMMQPQFLENNEFRLVADNTAQGNMLYQKYLGMKNSAELPRATHFQNTSYSFTVFLKDDKTATKTKRALALSNPQLIWHDYPGEWFEQDTNPGIEAQRRQQTFKNLLESDVALLLIDGEKIKDYAGQEERYLKSLFGNLRNNLLQLKEELDVARKPLTIFPRIWIMALSKSDLLPEMDVYDFRDLLIYKAGDEISELGKVLSEFISDKKALSIGEDFLLLSSANFSANRIDLNQRVGVDLLLPLAVIGPFERYYRWYKAGVIGKDTANKVLKNLPYLAMLLLGTKVPFLRKLRIPAKIMRLLKFATNLDIMETIFGGLNQKMETFGTGIQKKHDSLNGVLDVFTAQLNSAEEAKVLIRSKR